MKPIVFFCLLISFFSFSHAQTAWQLYDTGNSGLPNNLVRNIAVDGGNGVWAGTGGSGLAHFDGSNWTLYNTSNSALPGDYVLFVDIDPWGNVWVGTTTGAAKFDGTTWTVYTTTNSGLIFNNVRTINFDDPGMTWFGTLKGISSFDGVNWTGYTTMNSSLPDNDCRDIEVDATGMIWFGTDGGLTGFDGTNWTIYNPLNSGIQTSAVRNILIDAQDTMWMGSYLLNQFDGSNWKVFSSANSGLCNDIVLDVLDACNDSIWVGTRDSGLCVFDRGSAWHSHHAGNSPISSNRVDEILVDDGGLMWLATWNGLVSYQLNCQPPVGLQEVRELEVQLYPQPVTEGIGLTLSEQVWEGEVQVLDMQGRAVLEKSLQGNELFFPVPGLSSGIYLLQLREGGRVLKRMKFVVQKGD